MKKAWSIISTVLVALVLLLAVALMGARLIGFDVYTVVSGSMTPTYRVGDLIYVKQIEPAQVQVGDPITFVMNEQLVVATHRVTRIERVNDQGEIYYRYFTKGDANSSEDANPVHSKNLLGKPVFKLPYLGYLSDWIQHPPGTYIAIGGCCLLLALAFVPDLFTAKDKPKDEGEH